MVSSRSVRLGLGPPGSGTTVWLDSSVVGPAPALVRSMWGMLAPAPSDSEVARPAPDLPRPGLIAQSWVRLQTRSAVVLVSSRSVRLGFGPSGSGTTVWLESSVVGPAPDKVRSVWGMLAPASSDSDKTRPSPDQSRPGLIAQS